MRGVPFDGEPEGFHKKGTIKPEERTAQNKNMNTLRKIVTRHKEGNDPVLREIERESECKHEYMIPQADGYHDFRRECYECGFSD